MNLLSFNSSQTNQFTFHPLFDREYLLDFHGSDLTEILWAFEIFKENVVKEFYNLLPSCQQGRWREVVDLVHRLIPNFNIVGLTKYNQQLLEIESIDITSQDQQNVILRLIKNLTTQMKSVCQPVIEREISRMIHFLNSL